MKTANVTEWCSSCENEVELKAEFKKQQCPSCKEKILPCAQCESQNCSECPLEFQSEIEEKENEK